MLTKALLMLTLLQAPHDHGHGHGHGHGRAHGGHHGNHGNPEDLAGYLKKLEDPSRAEWQKPAEVLKVLDLKPGQTACDVGAGPGYFSIPLAKAVGEAGTVFALEVEPQLITVLRDRLEKASVHNVLPVLTSAAEPLLPPKSCDVILVVDTFHHFDEPVPYLKKLTRALKPGGRLVNIDFQDRETPVGPDVSHRVSREAFLKDATAAGLKVVAEPTFLPYQYFLVLQPG